MGTGHKFGYNKLAFSPAELAEGVEALGLARLPLLNEHIIRLPTITTLHKDSFDRLLLAQAQAESCALLTSDHYLLKIKYRTHAVDE